MNYPQNDTAKSRAGAFQTGEPRATANFAVAERFASHSAPNSLTSLFEFATSNPPDSLFGCAATLNTKFCPSYSTDIFTPNLEPCELTTFAKHGCRSNIPGSTPICPCHMDRAAIVAELHYLQERCSTLAAAVTASSSTTPSHQMGSVITPLRSVGDVTVTSPDYSASSSAMEPVVTGPEAWGATFTGDGDAIFEQPFDDHFRPNGAVGSQIPMLNQAMPAGDHSQLDAFFDNSGEADFFDFNAASRGTESATTGNTMTAQQSPTQDVSNSDSVVSSIPQLGFHSVVAVPAVTQTQSRLPCSSCMKTFTRPSDRDRHMRSHNPHAPRYPCSFPGCNRVGGRGFLRRDKLAQHRSHTGH